MIDLGTLSGEPRDGSDAIALNDAGEMAGESVNAHGEVHATHSCTGTG